MCAWLCAWLCFPVRVAATRPQTNPELKPQQRSPCFLGIARKKTSTRRKKPRFLASKTRKPFRAAQQNPGYALDRPTPHNRADVRKLIRFRGLAPLSQDRPNSSSSGQGTGRSSRLLVFWGSKSARQQQRKSSHLFVVPPVLQGKGLISRSRLLFFALTRRKKNWAYLAQNPGFCVAARAAIGRLLKRFSRFGRKKRQFLMARARIIFRGTAGNSGDFGSGQQRNSADLGLA